MKNSNSFIFSAVSDTQAVPQTTPAPAPQTTPAPIVTSTGYNYPVPENPLPIRPVSTTAPPPPEPLPPHYIVRTLWMVPCLDVHIWPRLTFQRETSDHNFIFS